MSYIGVDYFGKEIGFWNQFNALKIFVILNINEFVKSMIFQ